MGWCSSVICGFRAVLLGAGGWGSFAPSTPVHVSQRLGPPLLFGAKLGLPHLGWRVGLGVDQLAVHRAVLKSRLLVSPLL